MVRDNSIEDQRGGITCFIADVYKPQIVNGEAKTNVVSQ